MRRIVLRCPILPPGWNGADGLIRTHWAKRRDKQTTIETALLCMNREEILEAAALEYPVRVTFTRFYKGRPMDWDNCGASFKLVGDALVALKVLKDDDPSYVGEFRVQQFRRPGDTGFEVLIEELTPEEKKAAKRRLRR